MFYIGNSFDHRQEMQEYEVLLPRGVIFNVKKLDQESHEYLLSPASVPEFTVNEKLLCQDLIHLTKYSPETVDNLRLVENNITMMNS